MSNNRLTATQMADELTLKIGKKITVSKVQKALEQLKYVVKIGKKYIPTNDKGYYYSEKEYMPVNGYNVKYYLWDKSLIYEIEEVIREKYEI